ncbi:MAG: hypothetical protein Q8L76_12620 [Cypionkella sp.]|nr:hypothetical protein [Cypionkella sp.]
MEKLSRFCNIERNENKAGGIQRDATGTRRSSGRVDSSAADPGSGGNHYEFGHG